MNLPVFPRGDNEIIDEVSGLVCITKKTGDRDYIVKAINSHEKLVEELKEARQLIHDLTFKEAGKE